MTDPERSTADALEEQIDHIVRSADTVPTSNEHQAGRPQLDEGEREVKANVLRMGALVEDQIRAAIRALVTHDAEAATTVIAGDGRINEAQRHLSSLIAWTIATQQPVARDLRFLLSLDHVAYELERIGDHAASVAKQARKLAPYPPFKEYADLPRMGELVAELVNEILRALVDIDLARLFSEVVELMRSDPENVEPGTRVLFAAHYTERIGDRVTNIAEDVVYLATGEVEDLNP
jgi:phosphate transport system protein